MKPLAEQLASYAAYHKDPRTKLTHFFGVPMVTISLFIFLGWFRFIHSTLPITVAVLFYVGVSIYFLLLDKEVGAITVAWNLPLLLIAHLISHGNAGTSYAWFAIFFVGGWIIQLWGHYYEGKRPALMDNITQIFNAPLFLTCEVLFKLNKRPDLKPPTGPAAC